MNNDIYSYDGTSAVYRPKNMTPDELTQAYWEALQRAVYDKVYNKEKYLRKEMRRPTRCIFNMGVNLYYREQIKRSITPNLF